MNANFCNAAYLDSGFYAANKLPPSELEPCLKSLLAASHNWRVREAKQAVILAREFVDRWRQTADLWDSLDLSELDFVDRQKLRTEFFFVGTARPFRSHAERRTWSEDFINGWIRSNSPKPTGESLVDTRLRQSKEDNQPLTLPETIDLIKASGEVPEWDYPTETRNGRVYVDLSRHEAGILICDESFFPVLKVLVPFQVIDGKLYKNVRKHLRGKPIWKGTSFEEYDIGATAYYKYPIHHLAAWFKHGVDGGSVYAGDGNYLNLSGDNLYFPSLTGAQTMHNSDRGESANSYLLNERRKTNLQDWAAVKLTTDPVFAKPKAAKKVHSNNERSQTADKNSDDLQIERDYRVVQLN